MILYVQICIHDEGNGFELLQGVPDAFYEVGDLNSDFCIT